MAITNLKRHILKGCLSNIPPGCTTSANENLHKNLNKLTRGQKLGPELAFVIFSIFFYTWNKRRSNDKYSFNAKHVSSSSKNNTEEKFGMGGSEKQILVKSNQNFSGKWVQFKSKEESHPVISRLYLWRKLISKSKLLITDMNILFMEEVLPVIIEKLCNVSYLEQNENLEDLKFSKSLSYLYQGTKEIFIQQFPWRFVQFLKHQFSIKLSPSI